MSSAIAGISETGWTTICYPQAVFDEQLGQWISDAEVAETPFTAFTSRRQSEHVGGRLIVRRVRDANPAHLLADAQGELFPAWRYHTVFTDSPLPMLAAEADHRRHAIIEQVIADLKNGPLAHLPSGRFAANSAWPVLAAIAFNLTRATGCLASMFHAKATTATVRSQLITVPARIARSARQAVLHLPAARAWASAWLQLFSPPPPDHRRRSDPPAAEPAQPGDQTVEQPDRPADTSRPKSETPRTDQLPVERITRGASGLSQPAVVTQKIDAMGQWTALCVNLG